MKRVITSILSCIVGAFIILAYSLCSDINGAAVGIGIMVFGVFLSWVRPRQLGYVILGLLLGYCISEVLFFVLQALIHNVGLDPEYARMIGNGGFFIALIWGVSTMLSARARWYLEIPFVSLKRGGLSPRYFWLDASAIADPRLLDLAATGLLNRRCVLWRGTVMELQSQFMAQDEFIRLRAKRSLETIKKLTGLAPLRLHFDETEISPGTPPRNQLAQLAIRANGDLIVGELSPLENADFQGINVVSLHALSNALKPLTKSGEHLAIKILRQGKEPSQGVGYLQDDTMVVVNGAGTHIGQEVRTRVLSVKQSTAGRIVFCNLLQPDCEEEGQRQGEVAHRN